MQCLRDGRQGQKTRPPALVFIGARLLEHPPLASAATERALAEGFSLQAWAPPRRRGGIPAGERNHMSVHAGGHPGVSGCRVRWPDGRAPGRPTRNARVQMAKAETRAPGRAARCALARASQSARVNRYGIDGFLQIVREVVAPRGLHEHAPVKCQIVRDQRDRFSLFAQTLQSRDERAYPGGRALPLAHAQIGRHPVHGFGARVHRHRFTARAARAAAFGKGSPQRLVNFYSAKRPVWGNHTVRVPELYHDVCF